MLAMGTATFVFALISRWKAVNVEPYVQPPKGGEKIGDFEAFIGS